MTYGTRKNHTHFEFIQTSPPVESSDKSSEDHAMTATRPQGSKALTGSMATNRKKLASSPLAPSITDVHVETLQQEIHENPSAIKAIQAKLEQWEATTMSTLQDIRDLKQLFAQLQ